MLRVKKNIKRKPDLVGVQIFKLKIKNIKEIKMSKGKNQHVVPHKNGWAVRGEKNKRNTRLTETKEEALKIARQIAKNQKSELIIKNKQGKIIDSDSYGNDPFPKRDMKH